MSQWGARGQALKGADYLQILGRYYPGTTPAGVPNREVRVLLSRGRSTAWVSSRSGFSLTDGGGRLLRLPGGTYGFGGSLVVVVNEQRFALRSPIRITPGRAPLVFAGRPYRGALVVHAGSQGTAVVNAVLLEDYVRGVVPREMPSSWPDEALRAQAVAVRSYAVAGLHGRGTFDLYSDTRSQVYGGLSAERGTSDAAVYATTGQVLTWQQRVIPAFYHSTSGGRTAAVEDVWPSAAPTPYLVSRDDPEDAPSPHHLWGPIVVSASELGRRLGIPAPTSLTPIRNGSGRVSYVRISCASGVRYVVGSTFARALGLQSTWFGIAVAGSRATPAPPLELPTAVSKASRSSIETAMLITHTEQPAEAVRAPEPSQDEAPSRRSDSALLVALLAGALVLAAAHGLSAGGVLRLGTLGALAALASFATFQLIRETPPPQASGQRTVGAFAARPAPTLLPQTPAPRQTVVPSAHAPVPKAVPAIPWPRSNSSSPVPRTASDENATLPPASTLDPDPETPSPGAPAAPPDAATEPPTLPPLPPPPGPLEIAVLAVEPAGALATRIRWQTNLPAWTQAARGSGGRPSVWTETGGFGTEHESILVGLEPDMSYRAWLLALDEWGRPATAQVDVKTPVLDDQVQAGTNGDTVLVNNEPFFPRALWAQCAHRYRSSVSAGINLFMGDGCDQDGGLMQRLDGRAVGVIDAHRPDLDGPGVIGWHYRDEWDNYLPGTITREELATLAPEPPPGRVSFLTLTSHFYSYAAPLPQGRALYEPLLEVPDVVGFDLYPMQAWCRPEEFEHVYEAQRELDAVSGGKPTFQWIEVRTMECPSPHLTPTPDTVRAETWLAIAGGADAIGYFPNDWSTDVGAEIARTNRQIAEIAPALLGEPASAAADSAAVKVGARVVGGALYVIAVNASRAPVETTLRVEGMSDRSFDVLDEGYSVRASGGGFTDQFEPLAVHIYISPPPPWPPELWASTESASGPAEATESRVVAQ